MSAFSQETLDAQVGAVGDEVMLDHCGCPERESETTVQFLAAAARHIREPTIFSNHVKEVYDLVN